MSTHLKKYLATFLFVVVCLAVNGQENRYIIQHYTINDGLPENFLTDMTSDKKGFLWITTEGGDRLLAGTYKLIVRSQKGFGTSDYQYSSFNFTVLPYFYQTWWFYTLIVLAIVLVTAFFFLSKTRSLVRGKALLEKQVEARTVKPNESLDNLNIVIPILPVFFEIASLYKEISALNGNVIVIEPDLENVNVNTDRDILKLIIRNLVDNAVKNTKNGQISLSVAQINGISTITVADNGNGMDKKTLEKLLSEKVDTDKTLKTTSLGFGFVKRFLKLIHGSILIESEFGVGTKVPVSLNF